MFLKRSAWKSSCCCLYPAQQEKNLRLKCIPGPDLIKACEKWIFLKFLQEKPCVQVICEHIVQGLFFRAPITPSIAI